MAALTFDDLIPEGGAQPQAPGRRRVRALTFDDLLPARPQTAVPRVSGALTAEDFDRLTADAPMATTAPASPRSRALTFEDFDALTAEPPSTNSYTSRAVDLGRSVLSGLDAGVAGIAGLPADIARGAIALSDYEQAWRTGEPYERIRDQRDATAPMSSTVLDAYGSAAAHANSPARYDPQTAVGRGAATVAGFVPGALLTGGLGSVRAAAAQVAAPAAGTLAGQGLNQFTGITGTPAAVVEGIGGLAGGLGGMAALSPRRAEDVVRRSLGTLEPEVYARAQALMDDAGLMGVRLTGDEAIQHASNGATRLSDIRRIVENSAGGGNVMRPLMAGRPAQVQEAGRRSIDTLGPTLDPTETGLRVNRAATGEIADTQTRINAATRPAYDAATPTRVGPEIHNSLMSDPLYARTFEEVRGNPALNRTIEGMPADSVGVIDLVQRRMREGADAARAPGQSTTSNLIASNFDDARAAPIGSAEEVTGGATGSYATARAEQEALRRTQLEPLVEGPVGRLAGTRDAAAQAGGLFPAAPKIAGAEAGVADAVRRVATRDPEAAQGLIRGHVRAAFDEATQRLPSGPNELGGAKFASAISGNTQQAANLEAAVRALPSGDQRWQGFRRMLDVMEATGQRPPPGSPTAFIQEGQREMRQGSRLGDVVQAGKTGGTSLLKRFNEWKEQADLGRNTTQIANLLTRPDAARVLGQLANTPTNAARAQVLALRLTYMGRSGSEASGASE